MNCAFKSPKKIKESTFRLWQAGLLGTFVLSLGLISESVWFSVPLVASFFGMYPILYGVWLNGGGTQK